MGKLLPGVRVCVTLILLECVFATELLYGRNYHIRNAQNNMCLTSQANTYRAEVGVFLGQVTLEACEPQNPKQKWGVIKWSEENDDMQFWMYPQENGLNEVTNVLDKNGIYPINNLLEVGKINIHKGRATDERFVFQSLELNRCIASQGKGNSIAYDYCNVRSKDQQWKMDESPENAPANSISGRSFISLGIEFTKFALKYYFYPSSDSEQH